MNVRSIAIFWLLIVKEKRVLVHSSFFFLQEPFLFRINQSLCHDVINIYFSIWHDPFFSFVHELYRQIKNDFFFKPGKINPVSENRLAIVLMPWGFWRSWHFLIDVCFFKEILEKSGPENTSNILWSHSFLPVEFQQFLAICNRF